VLSNGCPGLAEQAGIPFLISGHEEAAEVTAEKARSTSPAPRERASPDDPFRPGVRRLRAERGITQRQMAKAIGVSPAYLSALEHGNRSEPSWEFVQRVIGYFNIIWDEAEELQMLAGLSRPRR
jgi:DNA-binding XRE family transcriptional regulator